MVVERGFLKWVCVCVRKSSVLKIKVNWRFETFRLVGIMIFLQSFLFAFFRYVFTINLVYCTKNSLLLWVSQIICWDPFIFLQPKVCFIRVTLKSVKSVYICSFTLIQTIASFCFNCMCVYVFCGFVSYCFNNLSSLGKQNL